jgi:hypothetical protein
MERLRLVMVMVMKTPKDHMFNFDPKTIDWDDYFTRIHIPGVLKYLCKCKSFCCFFPTFINTSFLHSKL